MQGFPVGSEISDKTRSSIASGNISEQARISRLLAGLQVCGSSKDIELGRLIAATAFDCGYGSNVFVMNKLIHAYGKCGSIQDARKVFHRMPHRNVVSWNSMILASAENGLEDWSLELFSLMQAEGFSPDSRSFVAALKACSRLAKKEAGMKIQGQVLKVVALETGLWIHAEAVRFGCDASVFVATSLIDMYSTCGSSALARVVFDSISKRNVVSWNAMMLAYTENGEEELAFELFLLMQAQGFLPDARTFVPLLKACTNLADKEVSTASPLKVQALEKGFAIHSEAAKRGCDSSTYVASSLVAVYARCGSLVDSRAVFERIPSSSRDVVLWNALLLGYAANDEPEVVLELFSRMLAKERDYSPNPRTFVAALVACNSLGALATA